MGHFSIVNLYYLSRPDLYRKMNVLKRQSEKTGEGLKKLVFAGSEKGVKKLRVGRFAPPGP